MPATIPNLASIPVVPGKADRLSEGIKNFVPDNDPVASPLGGTPSTEAASFGSSNTSNSGRFGRSASGSAGFGGPAATPSPFGGPKGEDFRRT
jgi:hypothetical protein